MCAGKKLLLLDVDNTIVIAKDNYIYKIIDGKEVPLTPGDFAFETEEDFKSYEYNFRDFEDPKKVADSLTNGKPVVKVLDFMRDKIDEGWEVGILTARTTGRLIKKIMSSWLLCRDDNDKWVEIGTRLKRVFAIGEIGGLSEGVTPIEKKVEVLKAMCKKYDEVIFIDDDLKYIKAANKIKVNNLIAINTKDI